MPQGRKKVPFSGKAKREQLQAKKHNKSKSYSGQKVLIVHNSDDEEQSAGVSTLNEQPSRSHRHKTNRYALKFFTESDEQLAAQKEAARSEIIPVAAEQLEIDGDDFFRRNLGFPKRPEWSYNMSRQELEVRENRYFTEYVNDIEKTCDVNKLSYFELNLETWRQLWRVLEMSDIVLLIVDVRYASAMFPPSLYEHVTAVLGKELVLVLNKVDLVPAPLVVAWKHYFTDRYPRLHVTTFTTVPGYNLRAQHAPKPGLNVRRRRGTQRMALEGTRLLYDTCNKIVGTQVDLTSWGDKIRREESEHDTAREDEADEAPVVQPDCGYYAHERYRDGTLTIGVLGQPNVGKSSVMNAIVGKKVVSVSRTPGHTKHFQTIHLTRNVRLCDCPGIVFPSDVPRALQVLMGSYPISQLRDPYTALRYACERVDVRRALRLPPPDDGAQSPLEVCEAWAVRRGYRTAKAARPDVYRAANSLLRMFLDGKLSLCLRPAGYRANEERWKNHAELEEVRWVQSLPEDVAAVKASRVSDTTTSAEDDDGEDEQHVNQFALLPHE